MWSNVFSTITLQIYTSFNRYYIFPPSFIDAITCQGSWSIVSSLSRLKTFRMLLKPSAVHSYFTNQVRKTSFTYKESDLEEDGPDTESLFLFLFFPFFSVTKSPSSASSFTFICNLPKIRGRKHSLGVLPVLNLKTKRQPFIVQWQGHNYSNYTILLNRYWW